MIRVPEVVRASFYQRLKDTGRRWIYGDSPADVETVYLRSLFSNFISSSPASMLAGLFLFFTAPVLPEGPIVGLWVSCHVVYHVIRMAVGLAYLRGTDFSAEQLRRWSLLSCGIQLIGGLLMLMLALFIFPRLEPMAQTVLMMVVFIVVGASAFSLAGRWAAIAVYATPTYLGFSWAAWWGGSDGYAKPQAVLSILFFMLYLMQARTQHRVNTQSYALARTNGALARELQAKNEQLQEVASARSRLLATVSHDLRQPSHAIGLLCERALLESNSNALKASLRDLNELSQSLSASLTTLMDLTRLDAGLVRPSVTPVALGQVLLRLEAEFAGSAKGKGLGLNVPHSELWVRSDPVLLHGVLANLVSNAIKYTRSGHIDIELTQAGDQVTLAVRDTGLGIKPDKLELIFKEFVRLEGADPGTEGLGLGLSIVKRYASLLGHALQVSSQPGQGSCFAIVLPVIEASVSQAEVQALSRSVALGDARLSGLRVLVVDNVDLVLSSMVRTLSAWGCEVHAGRSLAEARAVAQQQALDLVISDFHLGDEEPDGLALIEALRALPGRQLQAMPALLMTGDVSGQLEAEASRCRVGVLHKPVRPAVLQNRLLDLLQLRITHVQRPTTGTTAPS